MPAYKQNVLKVDPIKGIHQLEGGEQRSMHRNAGHLGVADRRVKRVFSRPVCRLQWRLSAPV